MRHRPLLLIARLRWATVACLGLILWFGPARGRGGDPAAAGGVPAVPDWRDSLVAYARTLEGHAYRAGGHRRAEGFDCSGLVYHAFREFGVDPGRSSRDQAVAGEPVAAEAACPGDIVVFAREPGGRVFHAGLIVEASADSLVMLHANDRLGVHLTDIPSSGYWREKVAGLRRVERAREG